MTNRPVQKSNKNAKTDIDSEFDSQDFDPSQESEPSEVEQQRKLIAALKELRRKDKAEKEKKSAKEKKFLQVAEKHLDRDLTQAISITEEVTKAVEAEFDSFVSKYTVQEDKIYDLWTQIQNEQVKLVDMANAKYERGKKAIAGTASAHLSALSNMNIAHNESRKIIDTLILSSESESESGLDISDDDT